MEGYKYDSKNEFVGDSAPGDSTINPDNSTVPEPEEISPDMAEAVKEAGRSDTEKLPGNLDESQEVALREALDGITGIIKE